MGSDEASWFSELAEARPVVCGGVPHVVGSDGKVSIERNCVCFSLLRSKNLKLKKLNKNFVPGPRESSSVSHILRFPMYISHIHVLVLSWICYSCIKIYTGCWTKILMKKWWNLSKKKVRINTLMPLLKSFCWSEFFEAYCCTLNIIDSTSSINTRQWSVDGSSPELIPAYRVGLRPCDRTHLKNGLVPYSYVGGT